LAEVQAETIPTEDEERLLVERAAQGDVQAQEELFRRNRRLVLAWAARYARRTGTSVPLEDLVQAGCIGLWKAVQRYDPCRHTRFSTYASFWIRQAIQRTHQEQDGAIRLPAHIHDLLRHDAQGLPVRNPALVEHVRRVSQPPLSLLSPPEREDADGDSEPREGLIGRDDDADRLEALNRRETLRELLAMLPLREEKILRLLFGFDDGRERTLAEVGQALGLSRERVRQLRERALEMLRELLAQAPEAL
jgi:RNA polymerase primary sigma factor